MGRDSLRTRTARRRLLKRWGLRLLRPVEGDCLGEANEGAGAWATSEVATQGLKFVQAKTTLPSALAAKGSSSPVLAKYWWGLLPFAGFAKLGDEVPYGFLCCSWGRPQPPPRKNDALEVVEVLSGCSADNFCGDWAFMGTGATATAVVVAGN